MFFPVSSVTNAASIYDRQKVYGERVKAYKTERPVAQIPKDSVTISTVAMESLAVHRKQKQEKNEIAYKNPRTRNVRQFANSVSAGRI